jgi:hypothetical protein
MMPSVWRQDSDLGRIQRQGVAWMGGHTRRPARGVALPARLSDDRLTSDHLRCDKRRQPATIADVMAIIGARSARPYPRPADAVAAPAADPLPGGL